MWHVNMQDLIEAREHWPLDAPEGQVREDTGNGRSGVGNNVFRGGCLAKSQLKCRSICISGTHHWVWRVSLSGAANTDLSQRHH